MGWEKEDYLCKPFEPDLALVATVHWKVGLEMILGAPVEMQ